MAQPPKTPTPAPPRRKTGTTARRTTRKATPKAEETTPAETTEAGAPAASEAAKPATRRAPAKRTTTRAAAPRKAPTKRAAKPAAIESLGDTATKTARSVRVKASAARQTAGKRVDSAARAVADSAPARLVADTRDRLGDRNFFAAILGGVAAIGAAIGGIIYAGRGTTRGEATKQDG